MLERPWVLKARAVDPCCVPPKALRLLVAEFDMIVRFPMRLVATPGEMERW